MAGIGDYALLRASQHRVVSPHGSTMPRVKSSKARSLIVAFEFAIPVKSLYHRTWATTWISCPYR